MLSARDISEGGVLKQSKNVILSKIKIYVLN
ncbi:Uncharacterised protein [Vibrio furnissii]|nr:Uncharacterised protein [Vibrio furnissii]